MSTVPEIEAAIEKLSKPQLEELVAWLDTILLRNRAPAAVDHWLNGARGAALPGATTDSVMALTRGEE